MVIYSFECIVVGAQRNHVFNHLELSINMINGSEVLVCLHYASRVIFVNYELFFSEENALAEVNTNSKRPASFIAQIEKSASKLKYGCMDVWLYGCMVAWMYGWLYGCMVAWMYGCVVTWMYGCMDVWLYDCMDGCMVASINSTTFHKHICGKAKHN